MVTAERLVATYSSDAFRLSEKGKNLNKLSLKDNVISYLAEYRFGLSKYNYSLGFENGNLVDPRTHILLEEIAHSAVGTRILEGKSISREVAEKEGIQLLDKKLSQAKKGDTIIWISPPGAKSEGYEDYGFVFYGKVKKENSGKQISMTAIRVEGRDLEKYNKTYEMLAGIKSLYSRPEQFISTPQVLAEDLREENVDEILGLSIGFKESKEKRDQFENAMRTMDVAIEDFIRDYDVSSLAQRATGFYSLENFALKLKRDCEAICRGETTIYERRQSGYIRLIDLPGEFKEKPPAVGGSCGSTSKNSLTSSNILSKLLGVNGSFGEQEWFHCPECGFQADGPIGDTCPGCKLTKGEYAAETGISCE